MSFNISTTSAFVVAGAGITVSKHGNRSISSKTGSADVLEALGVDINLSPDQTYALLKLNDIAFLFAQNVHPKMKQVTGIRRALGIPTIFNLIGPLTNPVELTTQLVGIYRRDLLMEMGATLHQLGRKRAVVINGPDYMDEAALHGETHGVLVESGELLPFTISPEDVGLSYAEASEIRGGDALENADILRRVLEGEPGPHRDTVLLNAALAIFADGTAQTVKEGVALAKQSIDEGHALKKLETMIAFSKKQKEVAK
ncbi:anthranilate phosphoribosyltransferase [Halolactibacillus sp. JCM 19043]